MRAIYFLLLLRKIYSSCSPGTLVCVEDQSKICDLSNNYILKDSSCVKYPDDNCEKLSKDGICIICKPAFFYNIETKMCEDIPTISAVLNCIYYSSDKACLSCSKDLYLSDGICVQVSKTVENCDLYSKEGICNQCALGYLLYDSQCQPIQQTDNCILYSKFQCYECQENYYYRYVPPNEQYTSVDQLRIEDFIYNQDLSQVETCFPMTDKYCLSSKSKSDCDQCQENFYKNPDTLKCQEYSTTPIHKCELYQSKNVCRSCIYNTVEKYVLVKGECRLANEYLLNCLQVDSQNKCIKCETNYYPKNGQCEYIIINNCYQYLDQYTCVTCKVGYILGSNRCIKKDNKFQNCQALKNSQVCQICDYGYYLDKNQLCNENPKFPNDPYYVDNCFGYTWIQDSLICTLCNSHYYPLEGLCIEIQDPNCEIYADQETCSSCINSSLNSGKCVQPLKPIDGCIRYQLVDNSKCMECYEGYKLVNDQCVPIIINNCIQFENAYKCLKCSPQYYLAGFICKHLNGIYINDCKNYSSIGVCSLCNPGYILSNKKCSIPFAYITNCYKYNVNGRCIQCLNGFIPVDGNQDDGFNACQIKTILISQCKSYLTIGKCMRCYSGYYLSSDSLSCLKAQPIFGCYEWASISRCKICRTGLYTKKETGNCYIPTLSPISNCFKYSLSNDSPTSYQCMQCLPNSYPQTSSSCKILATVINDCFIYDSLGTTCLKCQDGFVLKTNLCILGTIQSCLQYVPENQNQCAECVIGFYLSSLDPNNTCIKTASIFIQGCLIYNNSRNCQQYLPNYYNRDSGPGGIGLGTIIASTSIHNCIFIDKVSGGTSTCKTCTMGFKWSVSSCIKQSDYYEIDQSNSGACFNNMKSSGSNCSLSNGSTFIIGCWLTSFGGSCSIPFFNYYTGPTLLTTLIDNCDIYQSTSSCLKCSPGFVTYNGAYCDPVLDISFLHNCITTDAGFRCISCINGHYPNSNGRCKSVQNPISNCLQYNSNQQCISCAKDYYLNGNACSVITSQIPNCVQYLNLTSCSECMTGYYLTSTNTCQIILNTELIDHCVKYADQSSIRKCTACEYDYYLNTGNNSCTPYSQSVCYLATNASTCTQCHQGQFLFNGVCTQITNNRTPQCRRFNAYLEKCDECLSIYYLTTVSSSLVCQQRITTDNCIYFETLSDKCRICKKDYIPDASGACISTIITVANCQLGISASICYRCFPNYLLDEKSTNCYLYQMPNCVYFKDFGKCGRCTNNRKLTNDVCDALASSDTNCLEWISNDKCYKCNDNSLSNNLYYYLNSSNTCTQVLTNLSNCIKYSSSTVCQICQTGYYWDSTQQKCLLLIDSECLVYSSANTCILCNDNSILSDGICVLKSKDVNCKQFDNTETCIQCISNFTINLDTKLCTQLSPAQQVSNCQYYKSANKCIQCFEGYILMSQTSCISNPGEGSNIEGCYQYNIDGSCLKCTNKYYFDGSKCNRIPQFIENCLVYADPTTCSICQQNYTTLLGICVLIQNKIANCLQQLHDDKCLQCEQGYILDQNVCIKSLIKIQGCIEYGMNNTCVQCESDLYFHNNECFPVTISQCKLYISPNICHQCEQNYYVDQQGQCQNVEIEDSNCLIWEDKYNCKKCKNNFYIKQSGNCAQTSDSYCLIPFNENVCLVCQQGYLINQFNQCEMIKYIEQCKEFDQSGKCSLCSPGYFLNLDQSQCVKGEKNKNCKNGKIIGQATCIECTLGYKMINGKCELTEELQNLGPGCALISADKEKCLACQSGYYTEGKGCIKLATIPEVQSFHPIIKIFSKIIFLIILLTLFI